MRLHVTKFMTQKSMLGVLRVRAGLCLHGFCAEVAQQQQLVFRPVCGKIPQITTREMRSYSFTQQQQLVFRPVCGKIPQITTREMRSYSFTQKQQLVFSGQSVYHKSP